MKKFTFVLPPRAHTHDPDEKFHSPLSRGSSWFSFGVCRSGGRTRSKLVRDFIQCLHANLGYRRPQWRWKRTVCKMELFLRTMKTLREAEWIFLTNVDRGCAANRVLSMAYFNFQTSFCGFCWTNAAFSLRSVKNGTSWEGVLRVAVSFRAAVGTTRSCTTFQAFGFVRYYKFLACRIVRNAF